MASNSFGPQVGNMAKIFYINVKDADSAQGYFFNNKRKAQEKGMEIYDDFSFDLNGEEFEGDFGEQFIYSGIIDVKEGFLFYQEDGSMYVDAMSEEEARSAAEQFEGAGAYFPAKLKSGYGECYIGSATEHTNGKWSFEYGDIYENKKTMKHVKLFEQFVNERFNARRAEKELKAMGFKNVDGSDGEISVETEEMDNPFGHDAAFTFFWNGTDVWAEAEDGSYVEQTQPIETVEQFVDCMQFGEGWS